MKALLGFILTDRRIAQQIAKLEARFIAIDRKIARERSMISKQNRQTDTERKKRLGALVFRGGLAAESPLVVLGAYLSARDSLETKGDALRALLRDYGDRRFTDQRLNPQNQSAYLRHLSTKERFKRIIVAGGNVIAAGLDHEEPAVIVGIAVAAANLLSGQDGNSHRDRYQKNGYKSLAENKGRTLESPIPPSGDDNDSRQHDSKSP